MRFTDLYIKRPILATALNVLILVAGLAALATLQIRQYPKMSFTVITVTTNYVGASADLVQGFITQPLTQAIASADGIDYLTSSSTNGVSTITVYMRLNYDSSAAQSNILTQIQSVKSQLPKDSDDSKLAITTGESTKLIYLSLSSDVLDAAQITDYAYRVIQPRLATVAGVGTITFYGDRPYAMRIWLDPNKMAVFGLSGSQVQNVLSANNFQTPAGQIRGEYNKFDIDAQTNLTEPEQFSNLVISSSQNGIVRLRDIAKVELGPQNQDIQTAINGKSGVLIAIDPTPNANPIDVANGIKGQLPELEKNLPQGVELKTVYDTTIFIDESIHEVMKTIVEAVIIVTVVIFLFIGSFRAIAIPLIAMPLSLIGVAVLLVALGFTINLLTLLAIVLAIGLVVDDAIVVLENVERHIKEGKSPFLATIIGTREIAGPVIVMTITLGAVYAPIALTGGITGSLFKEFALTLAGSVVVSGVVALTLSPMLCSKLLVAHGEPSFIQRRIEGFLGALQSGYARLLEFVFKIRIVVVIFGVLVFASLFFLFGAIKSELAPPEDQGSAIITTFAPASAGPDYQAFYHGKLGEVLAKLPEQQDYFTIAGIPLMNKGFGIAILKPWKERERNAGPIIRELQGSIRGVLGIKASAASLPPLPGSGGGLPLQFTVQSIGDYRTLAQTMGKIEAAARQSGLFGFIDADLKFENPTVVMKVDADKAGAYGFTMQDIGQTLQPLTSNGRINFMNIDGRSYWVVAQTPRVDRLTPEAFNKFYLISKVDGMPIPLSNVINTTIEVRPTELLQMNQINASTFSATLAPGVTMGQAATFLTELAQQTLPPGFTVDWKGESRQYVKEGSALVYTFGFAILVIFLVLAAQYESIRDPLVIMVSVPLSLCGALIPLAMGLATMNIYSQVGLITLVGLITKHGILICEVAKESQEKEGMSRIDAVQHAASIRLRPILMTTAAMVAGLVPLLFASGAGAASRFAIGIVIVCGLAIGTLFTLFVLPVVYSFLASDHRKAAATSKAQEQEIATLG